MKAVIAGCFSLFVLTGCAVMKVAPKSSVEAGLSYFWASDELSRAVDDGVITYAEQKHEFLIRSNMCTIESKKVSIPSPSCTQPQRQDCSGLIGASAGFCKSFTPQPRCDYSSVNAAYRAQKEIFNSCMALGGWSLESVRKIDGAGLGDPSDDIGIDYINSVVDENYVLKHYRDNPYVPGYWNMCIELDKSVRLSGYTDAYSSLAERFEIVVEMMDVVLDETSYDEGGAINFILMSRPEMTKLLSKGNGDYDMYVAKFDEIYKNNKDGLTLTQIRDQLINNGY